PAIGFGIDDDARPVHVARLPARGRVGYAKPVGQLEAVAVAGPGQRRHELEPAFAQRLHAEPARLILEPQPDGFRRRSPEAKAHRAVVAAFGAEGHGMAEPHAGAPPPTAASPIMTNSTKQRPGRG